MEQTTFNPNLNADKAFNWNDFFSFKSMITLKIIQILYAIIAIVLTLYSLKLILLGGSEDALYGLGRAGGLLLLIFGNILWRVWCELIIVFFRINKTLSNIEDNTKK